VAVIRVDKQKYQETLEVQPKLNPSTSRLHFQSATDVGLFRGNNGTEYVKQRWVFRRVISKMGAVLYHPQRTFTVNMQKVTVFIAERK
jgi:hypothetical protein